MAPPPEESELRQFLGSLSDEMVYQLFVIMLLGRGDFGIDELAEYYRALKGTLGGPEQVAALLIERAPLADYLSDGLGQLRDHQIDVNHLPLQTVRVP